MGGLGARLGLGEVCGRRTFNNNGRVCVWGRWTTSQPEDAFSARPSKSIVFSEEVAAQAKKRCELPASAENKETANEHSSPDD